MLLWWSPVVVLCLFCASAYSADNPDEILSLPGVHSPPTFKQYSGYLKATGDKQLHYWFVESQNDPTNDPLLLWMNGGPGCSSLDGFLSELGPFHVNDDGTTLYNNPYSWNKVANIIFLEAPAGVGFSYSPSGNISTNDDLVAADNYQALLNFFVKYPDFQKNLFYITGESYAGYYVPLLAMQVINGNNSINLQGIAVGNGLHNYTQNFDSRVSFEYYHGIIGQKLWDDLHRDCCSGTECIYYGNTNPKCMEDMNLVEHFAASIGLNVYSIYLDCFGGVPGSAYKRFIFDMASTRGMTVPEYMKKFNLKWQSKVTFRNTNVHSHDLNAEVPCINATAVESYLNLPQVRKALHIPDNLPKWEICSLDVEMGYKRTHPSMFPQYQAILQNHRALVYSGDVDLACPFLGAQWFVNSLGRTELHPRRQWIYNNQVAGFVHELDALTIMTVKGAGHMVPQWRPAQALQMITNFLAGKPQ